MKIALVLAACAVVVASFPSPVTAADEAAFEEGYTAVQRLMSRGRYQQARDDLVALLDEHREESYVLVRRPEIEEDLKRCSFRIEYEEPDPKDLVPGELLSHNVRTGKIKIRFDREKMRQAAQKQSGSSRRSPKDELQRALAAIRSAGVVIPEAGSKRPLVFRGPYTIEAKISKNWSASASAYLGSSKTPTVQAALDAKRGYVVAFGRPPQKTGNRQTWVPARMRYVADGAWKTADEQEISPLKYGKSATLKVSVGVRRITASCNGRTILSAGKPTDLFGQFSVKEVPWTSVTIQGEAEPSWLQGYLDDASQLALARFEKEYVKSSVVPQWLMASASSSSDRGATFEVPGEPAPKQAATIERAQLYVRKGLHDALLRLATDSPDEELSPSARQYLLARAYAYKGKHVLALEHCRKAIELIPDHLPTIGLELTLLRTLNRYEEAVEVSLGLPDRFPEDAEAYEQLALAHFVRGDRDQARDVLRQAIERGVRDSRLDSIHGLLTKAEKGPGWDQPHEVKTRHYHIVSNIDRKTCEEAGKMLEEAYRGYTIHLERIPDLQDRRFRVYLFSGRRGFDAYCRDVTGAVHRQAAGLYSPSLGQLLIWNLPHRETMMQTIQHEGFHQYFDRLLDAPPAWLNEGLAEYYEIAGRSGGSWKEGQVHERDLERLRRKGAQFPPLSTLLSESRSAFYRRGADGYAHAWAFIHFLRQGPLERQRLFERLLEKLLEGGPASEAVREVFADVDLANLDRELHEHVAALQTKRGSQ